MRRCAFIMSRAGVNNEAAITGTLKRLNLAGIFPQGTLFNDMMPVVGQPSVLYQSEAGVQIGYLA